MSILITCSVRSHGKCSLLRFSFGLPLPHFQVAAAQVVCIFRRFKKRKRTRQKDEALRASREKVCLSRLRRPHLNSLAILLLVTGKWAEYCTCGIHRFTLSVLSLAVLCPRSRRAKIGSELHEPKSKRRKRILMSRHLNRKLLRHEPPPAARA